MIDIGIVMQNEARNRQKKSLSKSLPILLKTLYFKHVTVSNVLTLAMKTTIFTREKESAHVYF